jgi:RNA polymerase sigma-70 factor (ECF subfamily)
MEFFEIVDQAYDAGVAAWPGVSLSRTDFDDRVRLMQVEADNLQARGADLYLAIACASQNPAAVGLFEREFLAALPRQLGRVALTTHEEDELRQQVRVKLLVGPNPKILEYKGSGPLGAWVRVCALRMALDYKTSPDQARRGDNEALDALVGGTAAESMLDTEHHREAFHEALQEALAMLTAREKTLLRLHFIDGMNIDALGTVFQVHRATVARWLVAIRTRLLEDVRRKLSLEIGASSSEAQSLVRLLRSEVQVSIQRILGDETPP